MRNRITSTQRRHLTSDEMKAALDEPTLSDGAALTIASWWQSSGGPGAAFAELASTGIVNLDDLEEAIVHEFPEADRQGPEDLQALHKLLEWARQHPSRREAYHAEHPMDPADIRVGSIVRVPVWMTGEVIGWTNGEVTQVRACAERSYIVTLLGSPFTEAGRDFVGTEVLYYGYSIGVAQ